MLFDVSVSPKTKFNEHDILIRLLTWYYYYYVKGKLRHNVSQVDVD